ncbi:MAG: hypothetical protein MI919_29130 [Holophagales bacterium]|nr:hypothetical protein [Holophagales bacterium]
MEAVAGTSSRLHAPFDGSTHERFAAEAKPAGSPPIPTIPAEPRRPGLIGPSPVLDRFGVSRRASSSPRPGGRRAPIPRRARDWLERNIDPGWASCALTQNGCVRILSQPRYPNPTTVSDAIGRLGRATRTEHHELWHNNVSLLDPAVVDPSHLLGSRQVTDAYLLALAVAHGGRFVTFDRSVARQAVRGAAAEHLWVL